MSDKFQFVDGAGWDFTCKAYRQFKQAKADVSSHQKHIHSMRVHHILTRGPREDRKTAIL